MTLTTEQLRERAAAIRCEALNKADQGFVFQSQRLYETAAALDELADNREAQPVTLNGWRVTVTRTGDRQGVASISGPSVFCMEVPVEYSMLDFMEALTAPPAPAVPMEMTKEDAIVFVRERPPFKGSVECVQATWNACRAAMLENIGKPAPQLDSVVTRHADKPVSGGCTLPDNVRQALTLALQAMEFMGDTLNNIDAVCTEDVEYVTPAFNAVRELLAAAPEGGNG